MYYKAICTLWIPAARTSIILLCDFDRAFNDEFVFQTVNSVLETVSKVQTALLFPPPFIVSIQLQTDFVTDS